MSSKAIVRGLFASILVLAHVASPGLAQNDGLLGIYFDQAGTECHGTIEAGQSGTVYVVAKPAGVTGLGIAGAEFRFGGVPDAWETYPVPNPEMLSIGDPFGDGTTMGFVCNGSEGDNVVLYTVVVLATETVTDVEFTVEARNPPTNPNFNCSQLLTCDIRRTKICVTGASCFVNGAKPEACDTAVAVDNTAWSGVKALFR